jgi:hypothetical protein
MFLYNLTLQKGGGVQCAVYGNFSAPKAQEVVVSRNKVLELLRPDESGRAEWMDPCPRPSCFPSAPRRARHSAQRRGRARREEFTVTRP